MRSGKHGESNRGTLDKCFQSLEQQQASFLTQVKSVSVFVTAFCALNKLAAKYQLHAKLGQELYTWKASLYTPFSRTAAAAAAAVPRGAGWSYLRGR